MLLNRTGLVYTALRWLGYSDSRLTIDGASLCKVFWTLIFILPVVATMRLLGSVLLRWLSWMVDEDYDEYVEKGKNTVVGHEFVDMPLVKMMTARMLTVPIVVSLFGLAINRFVQFRVFNLYLISIAIYLGVIGVIVLVYRKDQDRKRKLESNEAEKRKEPNQLVLTANEIFYFIVAFIVAAKQKVCPIIRFG